MNWVFLLKKPDNISLGGHIKSTGVVYVVLPQYKSRSFEELFEVMDHEAIHYTVQDIGMNPGFEREERMINNFLETKIYDDKNYYRLYRAKDRLVRIRKGLIACITVFAVSGLMPFLGLWLGVSYSIFQSALTLIQFLYIKHLLYPYVEEGLTK
jgi:hypothetical protein